MDASGAERPQARDEVIARFVKALVNVLETFLGDGLDADQCALDIRLLHRREIFRVLGGLHGDLGEEDHVARQHGQPLHQLEALAAN